VIAKKVVDLAKKKYKQPGHQLPVYSPCQFACAANANCRGGNMQGKLVEVDI
jgi:hypothetical protein